MIERFKLFAESLRRQYPSSEPHLAVLSLGTAVLDLRVGSRVYVVGYYPSLSRLAVFGPDGHTPFKSFDEAEFWLRGLLRSQNSEHPFQT